MATRNGLFVFEPQMATDHYDDVVMIIMLCRAVIPHNAFTQPLDKIYSSLRIRPVLSKQKQPKYPTKCTCRFEFARTFPSKNPTTLTKFTGHFESARNFPPEIRPQILQQIIHRRHSSLSLARLVSLFMATSPTTEVLVFWCPRSRRGMFTR